MPRPQSKGLTVTRRFTTAGEDPFASFTFVRRLSRISNPDGSAVFEMDDVEVPDTWDQVATDILASKYFRKAGVPQFDADGNPVVDADGAPVLGPERSARQVMSRLADAWHLWGTRGGYFASDEDALAFRDEMAFMLMAQMGAPNTPQFFNTGIFESYGIMATPEGNWFFDEEAGEVRLSAHRHERSAVSACYISAVADELVSDGSAEADGAASIFEFIEREARLFKSGSGSGANFSRIRGEGERLSGGGTSSGVMSFLRVADRAAGAIKSGGSSRRAAKMVILDADHPDIEAFIWCKVLEERKVAALGAAGYSTDFNGDAYDTVSMQNGNNTVRIPAGFMERLRADASWALTARTTGETLKELPARELWDAIAEAAWTCADPGLQFDDILNDWNTALDTERVNGSNPCSEYTHVDDTACNLASLNLVKFWDEETRTFDVEGYVQACRLFQVMLEISVSMAHYPSATIAKKSFEHRTTGLGFCNIGSLLMRAGLAYDSDQARAAMGAITSLMNSAAYQASAEMAAAVGPCLAFKPNKGSMLRVLRNHRRAAVGSLSAREGLGDFESLTVRPLEVDHLVLAHTAFANLSDHVVANAHGMVKSVERHGARNLFTTVVAPTGTVSLLMQASTSGAEPDFALVKLKKLAGGGYMQIVNNSVEPALRTLGYDEGAIGRILTHTLGTKALPASGPVSADGLVAAGLTADEVAKVAAALPSMSQLDWAFSSYTVGDEAFVRHGLDPVVDDGAALLAAMGVTAAQLREASLEVCGHMTVEGAPDLRDEHLPVFDCAVECGDGTRSISWEGHVRALGAMMPHLSGAISKTVNLPNSATVDDVRGAHQLAYDLGVKCVAIYRDGSKLSQPLNSAKSGADEVDVDDEEDRRVLPVELPVGMSPTQFYGGHTPPRFRLPAMRPGVTWRLEVGGEEIYVTTGEFPDGAGPGANGGDGAVNTLGEVFLSFGKDGSTLRGFASALSIAISQGLQHGVPLEAFVKAYKGQTFEPRGMVNHPQLRMASSVPDAVARLLALYYLGDDSGVQVKGQPDRFDTVARDGAAAQATLPVAPAAEAGEQAAEAPPAGERVYGKTCSNCGGSNLISAGTCAVCGDCGTTTGCS